MNFTCCHIDFLKDYLFNIHNAITEGNIKITQELINKIFSITHHTALIGVTGTGKSVFSRNLIREYLKDDKVKIISQYT